MAKSLVGIKPLHHRVLVGIYDDGDTTRMLGGKKFYLLDDSSADKDRNIHVKHQGVRPRWALVLAVSDHLEASEELPLGSKVLLDQLTWTRGMTAMINGKTQGKVWSIPFEDILGIESNEPTEFEQQQIARLYPDWETWHECDI